MAEFIIDDDIDFDAYMQATESDHRVVSADTFIDEVIDYFHNEEAPKGAAMPWQKTANVIRFRQGEVTLWTGMNGHGKSLVLGQTCVSLVMQKERVVSLPCCMAGSCCGAAFDGVQDGEAARRCAGICRDRPRVFEQAGGEVSEAGALPGARGDLGLGELDDLLVGALGKDGAPGVVVELVRGGIGNARLLPKSSAEVALPRHGRRIAGW